MLKFLLNFWLLPIFGTFLASATIGDVGAGGGDGGGVDQSGGDDATSSDAGDDGSGSHDEGSQDDTTGEDLLSDGQDEADIDPDALVDLGDGRQGSAQDKKLIENARKLGPEALKRQKQLIFAEQRLLKSIPGGVNGAIELAKTIDQLGGIEGIQDLQSNLETHNADAELFASNPAKWIETGFQENSEASLKAFDASLSYISEKHPEHYDYRAAGIIIADLNSASPVGSIHKFLSAQKDNPEAQKLAKELYDYYKSREATAKTSPEKKPDAQTKALADRESTVKKSEMDLRYKQVNTETLPALKSEVTKVLRSEAKASGIDIDKLSKEYPAEWRNMLNEIHQEIMKSAVKDQRFISKYAALVEKGNLKRAAKAVNDKHADIAADIVRQVKATYGVFRGKKVVKPAGDKGATGQSQQVQNQGFQRVSKRPENSLINWSKTTSAMQLDGKYILNDGKKVVVQY